MPTYLLLCSLGFSQPPADCKPYDRSITRSLQNTSFDESSMSQLTCLFLLLKPCKNEFATHGVLGVYVYRNRKWDTQMPRKLSTDRPRSLLIELIAGVPYSIIRACDLYSARTSYVIYVSCKLNYKNRYSLSNTNPVCGACEVYSASIVRVTWCASFKFNYKTPVDCLISKAYNIDRAFEVFAASTKNGLSILYCWKRATWLFSLTLM